MHFILYPAQRASPISCTLAFGRNYKPYYFVHMLIWGGKSTNTTTRHRRVIRVGNYGRERSVPCPCMISVNSDNSEILNPHNESLYSRVACCSIRYTFCIWT